MQTTSAGPQRSEGLGHRPRLHGHVATSTPAATTPNRSRRSIARSISASTSSTRRTSTGRTPTRSSSGARSAAAATRSFLATKFGVLRDPKDPSVRGFDSRPEYVRRAIEASLARLGVDDDRPLLPASRRSEGADRGDRRRARRARAGGQGPPHRPFRGVDRDAASARIACIRSPRCRANTRCGRAIPRTACWRRAGGSASGSFRTARSAAASSPARSSAPRTSRRTITGAHTPRFQGENFARNLALVEKVEGARGGDRLHAGPARARLGARAGRRSRPDPGHQAAQLPRGKRRRAVAQALARAARGDRRGVPARASPRERAIPRR